MRKRLHKKGWEKAEIDRVERIIKKAEKNKHPHVKKLENSLYWFTLIIGILGTVFFSIMLIPILIASTNTWGYVLTGMLGFLLGALIIIIIKDLHWLEDHHHLFIALLIPVIALLNFIIVVNRVNALKYQLGLGIQHHPFIIGIIYLICFLIPYMVFLFLKRR